MAENEVVLERGKEQLIPYRAVPLWVEPTAAALCLFGIIGLLFAPASVFSLATLICGGAGLAPAALFALEIFLRALSMMLLAVLGYLTFELARHDYLVISKDSITFPVFLAPDLLFNRKRTWDDIANVLLGRILLEDKRGTYEYELEEARDKRRVFIYFKSGGHVSLDLNMMPKQSTEVLFSAIQPFCLTCTRAPISRKEEANQQKKLTVAPQIGSGSYTQIWEDDMRMHFSATNFVPLEKGATLQSGKYSILMQLSCGGLSAVYLAEQPDKSLVVLKEAALPTTVEENSYSKAKELFQREAQILTSLNHAKIAKVYDFFVEKGRDYLVIDFVAGDNLRQVVRRRGVQSERTVLTVAKQTAQILSYLHSCSPPVVHRDITPDNLILKDDDQVFLIDFGAANQYVGTATGTLIGQQCYIAPEQFRGKSTIQSDYYSLGATLYFLLTGRDPEALMASHPKFIRNDISEELDQFIFDLTSLDPTKRPSSADELIDRVNALIPETLLTV